MRAVRSVINAAGLLKKGNPDTPEEQLMLRGLRDVNVPKFLKDDLPLFENIIADLFPGVERPTPNYKNLLSQLNHSCDDMNLQNVKMFIDKVKILIVRWCSSTTPFRCATGLCWWAPPEAARPATMSFCSTPYPPSKMTGFTRLTLLS
jgi:hypothetical protein